MGIERKTDRAMAHAFRAFARVSPEIICWAVSFGGVAGKGEDRGVGLADFLGTLAVSRFASASSDPPDRAVRQLELRRLGRHERGH